MSNIESTNQAFVGEPASEKLNFSTKLAYGAGDMGPAITANVLVFFLLYFFTNVAGLPAGLAGSILMIGKIGDAINDPVVGVMSDRTKTVWGRRLPWMLAGAIPFGVLFFLQWLVPPVNQWLLFIYYVAIGILFNIAYTIVNLPYTALTPELTQDYNERTNLNSFRFAFSIGGSILSLILAQVVFQQYPDDGIKQYLVLGLICTILSVVPIFWCTLRIQERGATPFLDQNQKKILGILLCVIGASACIYSIFHILSQQVDLIAISTLILGLVVATFGVTLFGFQTETHLRRIDNSQQTPQSEAETSLSIQEQLKIVFSNKPFLYVIGIYLCSWLAVQLTASILIYFVVSWMGLSEQVFPTVAVAVQGTALVMLFVWKAVSARLGKKVVYFLGVILWIVAQAGLFFLQPGQIPQMYFLAVLAGFGVSVAYLIPWSMVPDVIELDELQTGQRREGIFYSFMVFLQKMTLALALFGIGKGLDWAGFIERIPGEVIPTQPDSALLAIRLAIGPLPTIALIAGLILAYFYPINREFHQQIRLQLLEKKGNTSNNQ